MKTEIVKIEQINQEIDWSKPQLLKAKRTSLIVWTNGFHSEESFSGIVLVRDERNCVGLYIESWVKSLFTPITEPVTIKFIP